MSLKLYCDLMSQPSRTLYILLKTINCDFQTKFVNLRKGEHYTDEFTKLNRIQMVPVMEHNGFVLIESVAIVDYLSREGIIPESLYPRDSKQKARVQEFLEWYHAGLRNFCAMFFKVTETDPMMTGKKPDGETVAGYKHRMVKALEVFCAKWLDSGTEFILGETVTIADLFAACELEQPRMADYDPQQHFPVIATWAKKVRDHFNPHYDEAHVKVYKMISNKMISNKI